MQTSVEQIWHDFSCLARRLHAPHKSETVSVTEIFSIAIVLIGLRYLKLYLSPDLQLEQTLADMCNKQAGIPHKLQDCIVGSPQIEQRFSISINIDLVVDFWNGIDYNIRNQQLDTILLSLLIKCFLL